MKTQADVHGKRKTWSRFPFWLTALLVVAIALFTWRTYTTVTPYGWV